MILDIIGWVCITHLIVDFISTLNLNIPNKPFKCDMCMGTWLSLIPLCISYGFRGVFLSAIVGILADILFRLKQRL